MDATEFVEWAWAVHDDAKPALADRICKVRASADDRFLREARSAAESAIVGTGFDPHEANVAAAPEDALKEDGTNMEAWNRDAGHAIMAAYEDALLAIGAAAEIGKEHRRVLAGPMLPEVPGLSEVLGLAESAPT